MVGITVRSSPGVKIMSDALYIFIDEGGNLDFSPSGTKYFTITSVTTARPFVLDAPLIELRFDLVERGLDLEYFHAAEDKQPTRNAIFTNHSCEVYVDAHAAMLSAYGTMERYESRSSRRGLPRLWQSSVA